MSEVDFVDSLLCDDQLDSESEMTPTDPHKEKSNTIKNYDYKPLEKNTEKSRNLDDINIELLEKKYNEVYKKGEKLRSKKILISLDSYLRNYNNKAIELYVKINYQDIIKKIDANILEEIKCNNFYFVSVGYYFGINIKKDITMAKSYLFKCNDLKYALLFYKEIVTTEYNELEKTFNELPIICYEAYIS